MSLEFLITSLIVVLAPGTGVIYTIATGISRGRSYATAAAFGCTIGIVPHLVASILGLSAILHTSALLFQSVKYAGVLYLLYLAWQALKGDGALSMSSTNDKSKNYRAVIATGFLINILNPKLSIFFLAFLPQFVDTKQGSATLEMGMLGLIFMGMTLGVFIVYGLFAAKLRHHVIARPNILKWFNRGVAGAFTGLSLKLALSDR